MGNIDSQPGTSRPQPAIQLKDVVDDETSKLEIRVQQFLLSDGTQYTSSSIPKQDKIVAQVQKIIFLHLTQT